MRILNNSWSLNLRLISNLQIPGAKNSGFRATRKEMAAQCPVFCRDPVPPRKMELELVRDLRLEA